MRSTRVSAAVAATRRLARLLIRIYQLTLSALVGRQCRHLPRCSSYDDEAIERHGLWFGGWIGVARLCRCHPLGTHGFDPVPRALARGTRWFRPWRAAYWRRCHTVDEKPADDRQARATMVKTR